MPERSLLARMSWTREPVADDREDAEQRLGGVIPAGHAVGGIGDDHGFGYRVEQAADARAGTDRAPPSSPSDHSCP